MCVKPFVFLFYFKTLAEIFFFFLLPSMTFKVEQYSQETLSLLMFCSQLICLFVCFLVAAAVLLLLLFWGVVVFVVNIHNSPDPKRLGT